MTKSLFITEKPSVAREFVKLLKIKGTNNDGYIEGSEGVFTWCVGHMVTMSYPESYDETLKRWALKDLPFLPEKYKYEIIAGVAKQFNIVRKLLTREDITTIYVCTDSGREGEYIYRLVDEMVGVQGKEKKRVWIDSQTEEEIKRGIEEAKDLTEYDSLADSAYLRAKEDYLVGINFSRLLTLLYGRTVANLLGEKQVVIAVGRVMSCVLGMIVEREREIRNFTKTSFYKIAGDFGVEEGLLYEGEWKAVEGSAYFASNLLYNEVGFRKKEDAQRLIDKLQGIPALIKEVNKSTEKKNAPLLFNLAELQNECSKRFKINPDETLQKIQLLYEKKMLTYPRTDARVLSKAVAKEIEKNLQKLSSFGQKQEIKEIAEKVLANQWQKNLAKTKYVDDSKITDHYAIIPTGEGLENYGGLKDLEKEIYLLVVRRFLAIFYPPAKYSKITVTTMLGQECFFTSQKICLEKGYLEVLEPEKEREKESSSLNGLKKGQKVDCFQLTIKEGETTPPKRYTSGSIIIAMENAGKLIEDEELREQIKGSGIGTSATRAEILKKLEKIGYLSTNKKTQILTPTTKGEILYEVIRDSLPSLLNPILTASWEKGLKLVLEKQLTSQAFMDKLDNYIRSSVQKVLQHNGELNLEQLFAGVLKDKEIKVEPEQMNDVLGICPFCQNGQVVKNSKGYGCSNWKSGCKFFLGQICGKTISPTQIKKLIKTGKTDLIKGFKSKAGKDFTARLILREQKIEFDFS